LAVFSIELLLTVFLLIMAVYLIVKAFKLLNLKYDAPLLLSLISITVALALQITTIVLSILIVLSQGDSPVFPYYISGATVN
jgi:hypothetical protein